MNDMTQTPLSPIGQSTLRREDFRFLTGAGQYTDDVVLPGQTHAVFLRSPLAHARIKSIDIAAAAKAPGVIRIFTGVASLAMLLLLANLTYGLLFGDFNAEANRLREAHHRLDEIKHQGTPTDDAELAEAKAHFAQVSRETRGIRRHAVIGSLRGNHKGR